MPPAVPILTPLKSHEIDSILPALAKNARAGHPYWGYVYEVKCLGGRALVLLVLTQGIDCGTGFHACDADKNAQHDHHEIDEEFALRVPNGDGHKSEL